MTSHDETIDRKLHERRERVFLVFAGIFLGTLAMLNILGITRFIRFGSVTWGESELTFAVAVGVLPYPITFLCTGRWSSYWRPAAGGTSTW